MVTVDLKNLFITPKVNLTDLHVQRAQASVGKIKSINLLTVYIIYAIVH